MLCIPFMFISIYHPRSAFRETPFMTYTNSYMFWHQGAILRESLLQACISQNNRNITLPVRISAEVKNCIVLKCNSISIIKYYVQQLTILVQFHSQIKGCRIIFLAFTEVLLLRSIITHVYVNITHTYTQAQKCMHVHMHMQNEECNFKNYVEIQ